MYSMARMLRAVLLPVPATTGSAGGHLALAAVPYAKRRVAGIVRLRLVPSGGLAQAKRSACPATASAERLIVPPAIRSGRPSLSAPRRITA